MSEEFPKIGSNNNYWIKIIVNYWELSSKEKQAACGNTEKRIALGDGL